jgi:shikimate dehydrogenase
MRDLKLAVIGDPVAHSASPALHRGFLAEAGLAGTYEAIRVGAGEGAREIARLRAAGYTGLNVTTPLKEEAFACAAERDAAARAAHSVNTLVLAGDRIRGYNTDGLGALGALRDAGLASVAGKRLLVLGAGPTARSCIASFVECGALVFVWNRTIEKARSIAAHLGARIRTPGDAPPDAVLSALPPHALPDDAALRDALAAAPLVIDANYGERATLGAALGRPVIDGAAMLRASARASFDRFRAALER